MVARNARDAVHDSDDGTVVFFLSKGSRRNKHLGTRALIKGGHGNSMSRYTMREGRRSRDNHICGSEFVFAEIVILWLPVHNIVPSLGPSLGTRQLSNYIYYGALNKPPFGKSHYMARERRGHKISVQRTPQLTALYGLQKEEMVVAAAF